MAAREQWKPIVGYEGIYTINNFGVIKNAEGRIKKPSITNDGYLRVTLSKCGKHRHYLVHRLVAFAFIPNPQNLPIINHKDENKKNNFVFVVEDGSVDLEKSNLEWCTYQYNVTYNNRVFNGRFERKAVEQYDLQGNFIAKFISLKEPERQTGISACNISLCCKGSTRYKHAGGFLWKYERDLSPIKLLPKIIQLSLDGEVVNVFDSINDASKYTNIHCNAIRNCIAGRSRRAGIYKWERRYNG